MPEALKYWPYALVQAVACLIILMLVTPFSNAEEVYKTGIESNRYYQQSEPTYQTGTQAYQGQNDMGIIGVEFSIPRSGNGVPIIKDVYPGTSGFYAGLQPGDKILMINGQSAKGLNPTEVDNAISEVPGDTVTFLIDHYGTVGMKAVVVMPLSTVMNGQLKNKYSMTSFAATLSKMKDVTPDW